MSCHLYLHCGQLCWVSPPRVNKGLNTAVVMLVLTGPLSLLRCEGFLKRVSCFYRCSPDAARWPHPHRRSYIQAVPLCHSFCRDWWGCQTHWQSHLNQNQYLSPFTYKAVKWERLPACVTTAYCAIRAKTECPINSIYGTGKTKVTYINPLL